MLPFVLAFEVSRRDSMFRSQCFISIVSLLYPPQKITKALSNEQCPASCFGFWVGGCKQIIANHPQKTRLVCSSIIHFWIRCDFSSFQGWNQPRNIGSIFFESFDRSVSSLSWAYGLTPYHCCLFTSQNMRSLEDVKIFCFEAEEVLFRACCW